MAKKSRDIETFSQVHGCIRNENGKEKEWVELTWNRT